MLLTLSWNVLRGWGKTDWQSADVPQIVAKYKGAFKSFLKLSFWQLILNPLEISSIYVFGS